MDISYHLTHRGRNKLESSVFSPFFSSHVHSCLFSLLGTHVCGTAVHDASVNNVSLSTPLCLSPLFSPFVLGDIPLSLST
jgi:hypothetical protein